MSVDFCLYGEGRQLRRRHGTTEKERATEKAKRQSYGRKLPEKSSLFCSSIVQHLAGGRTGMRALIECGLNVIKFVFCTNCGVNREANASQRFAPVKETETDCVFLSALTVCL